jgi:hypothetical protein
MKPIPKDKRPKRPETVSQTLLAHLDRCRYSGLLYMRHRDDPSTPPLIRGSVYHDAKAKAIEWMFEQGEREMPGELAKEFAQHIIEEHVDADIPGIDQDAIRLMMWNWAESYVLDPETFVGVEILMVLEIDDWIVRGRIDELNIRGEEAFIKDDKTSLHRPDQEEYEAQIQNPLYALFVAEGTLEDTGLPIGGGCNIFHTYQQFPRYRMDDGTLFNRYAVLGRLELADWKDAIRVHLKKLDHSLENGEWPATPGTHCNSYCPARRECPIPDEDHPELPIANLADAAKVMETAHLLDLQRKDLFKAGKVWAQENGVISFGDNLEYGPREQTSRKVDRDGITQAAYRAAAYGEPFDPDDFVTETGSNRWAIRQREKV